MFSKLQGSLAGLDVRASAACWSGRADRRRAERDERMGLDEVADRSVVTEVFPAEDGAEQAWVSNACSAAVPIPRPRAVQASHIPVSNTPGCSWRFNRAEPTTFASAMKAMCSSSYTPAKPSIRARWNARKLLADRASTQPGQAQAA